MVRVVATAVVVRVSAGMVEARVMEARTVAARVMEVMAVRPVAARVMAARGGEGGGPGGKGVARDVVERWAAEWWWRWPRGRRWWWSRAAVVAEGGGEGGREGVMEARAAVVVRVAAAVVEGGVHNPTQLALRGANTTTPLAAVAAPQTSRPPLMVDAIDGQLRSAWVGFQQARRSRRWLIRRKTFDDAVGQRRSWPRKHDDLPEVAPETC